MTSTNSGPSSEPNKAIINIGPSREPEMTSTNSVPSSESNKAIINIGSSSELEMTSTNSGPSSEPNKGIIKIGPSCEPDMTSTNSGPSSEPEMITTNSGLGSEPTKTVANNEPSSETKTITINSVQHSKPFKTIIKSGSSSEIKKGPRSESQCKENKSKDNDMKGDMLQPVGSKHTPKQSTPIDMKGMDMCVKHKKRFLFYCPIEDALLCGKCLVLSQRQGQEMQELEPESVITDNNGPTLGELSIMLLDIDRSTKQILTDLNEAKESSGQNLGPIINTIDGFIERLQSTKANITYQEQERGTEVDEMIAKISDMQDTINMFQDILPTVIETGSDAQKFILKHMIGKQAAQIQTIKTENKVRQHKLSVDVNPQLTELLTSEQLATLYPNLKPKEMATKIKNGESLKGKNVEDSEKNTTKTQTGQVEKATQTDTILDLESDLPFNKPMELIHRIKLDKQEGDEDEPLYTGMEFLLDGRLVTVDNGNAKLVIYDETLTKIGMFKLKVKPESLAVLSEDEVVVTTGQANQIHFIRISKTNKIHSLRCIKTSVIYSSISAMNANVMLVSTLEDNRPMRMIRTDGKEEDFDNLEQKKYSPDGSRCTYISSSNTIALTDRLANTLYLYTRNSSHVKRQAVQDATLQAPMGVCKGPGNSVFVCSRKMDSIVQVSTSGTILESHKLDMVYPITVCMSRYGRRIAVSNGCCVQNELHIYQFHRQSYLKCVQSNHT